MSSVKEGKKVTIHYEGKLEDGTIFDSTEGQDPLEFVIGEGSILPKFEEHLLEMSVGDSKTFTLDVEDAYGEKKDEMVVDVPRSTLPQDLEPKVGIFLEIGRPGEPTTVAEIIGVTDDSITIDVNHPLSGKSLTFKVKVVSVE